MDLKLRENKKRNKTRFTDSLGYATDGLKYAFKYEIKFLIYPIVTIIVVATAFILNISAVEWCIIIFSLALVMAFELVNSAIEACIDLISPKYHVLAKVAKDCAAAAVLVIVIVTMIIGVVIFIPKLISYIV